MDILTAIVCSAFLVASAALILEIALKRPETFREIRADTRAFAEAQITQITSQRPSDTGHDMKGGRLAAA